jgi:hypothetical protein
MCEREVERKKKMPMKGSNKTYVVLKRAEGDALVDTSCDRLREGATVNADAEVIKKRAERTIMVKK